MPRRSAFPWIVLAASLLLTAGAATTLERSTRARDDEAFRNATEATQDRIEARMNLYIAILRGTAGLILSQDGDVSQEVFTVFAGRLRMPTYYPGIRGLGYSRLLRTASEADALVQQRRRDLPAYSLWPATPGPERHAIVHLYPLDERNRIALGYSMHSEAVRRAAMDRARDEARAILSGRVVLVQEQGAEPQPGFLVYVPVYRGNGEPPVTLAERRAMLIGYAYAAFRARELFQGVFGSESRPHAAFRIFDGARADTSALLYDSRSQGIAPATEPARTATAAFEVAGHRWTITFAATPTFAQNRESFTPLVVAGGLVMSLLLFGLAGADVRTQRLMLQNERRFRVLLESMPVAVTVTDADGGVTFRNARAASMDSGGMLYHHETRVPVPLDRLPLARALQGERVEGEILDLEAPDGFRRTVMASAFPVLTAEGKLQMAVSAEVDVTDQKRAEERAAQLRRHTRELERSNRELQEFAYVASHDLQEPLRKISAFSDLLRHDYGPRLDDEGRRYLTRMQDAALRMSMLIKDLLAFSRISAHTRTFEPVDLGTVVDEVVQDLWARLHETGGTVDARDLPVVRADPMQMRQLFQNLIGNALKFHRPGVPPEVRVRGTPSPITTPDGIGVAEGWLLTVQDNGIGFDEKYAARIFAPFQRLHTRGEYEGTGIGLAVCRRIAERHGGTIYVRSTPGAGTTFTVELPASPTAA